MALANTIKAGAEIGHFGTFRTVLSATAGPDKTVILSIQEDGIVTTRTLGEKFNIPVLGE